MSLRGSTRAVLPYVRFFLYVHLGAQASEELTGIGGGRAWPVRHISILMVQP